MSYLGLSTGLFLIPHYLKTLRLAEHLSVKKWSLEGSLLSFFIEGHFFCERVVEMFLKPVT